MLKFLDTGKQKFPYSKHVWGKDGKKECTVMVRLVGTKLIIALIHATGAS